MKYELSEVRVALHTCCGPCLIEPFDAYRSDALEVVVVYFNPNIHPPEEYVRRRDAAAAYTSRVGAQFVELPYDTGQWLDAVGEAAASPTERCRACYGVRMRAVAAWAAGHGYDAVATTLAVSPYQDHAALAEVGEETAREAGVSYVDRDFRDRFAEGMCRARELGIYRQNYCGCKWSEREARDEREARRARRGR